MIINGRLSYQIKKNEFLWYWLLYIKIDIITEMNIMLLCTSLLILTKSSVNAYGIRTMPVYSPKQWDYTRVAPVINLQLLPANLKQLCYFNNVLMECLAYPMDLPSSITNINRNAQRLAQEQQNQERLNLDLTSTGDILTNIPTMNQPPPFRRMINQRPVSNLNMLPVRGKSDGYVLSQNIEYPALNGLTNNKLNMKLDHSPPTKLMKSESEITESEEEHLSKIFQEKSQNPEVTTALVDFTSSTTEESSKHIPRADPFLESLDNFERTFYGTTFNKLRSISTASRRENGMSYVQSGLYLQLALMALSTEVDSDVRREIDECLDLHASDKERIKLINETVSSLPTSNDDLKFRWSSRLVLQSQSITDQFRVNAALALRLQVDSFNGTETSREMAVALNRMVEQDSGGAIHNTFEEDDLSEGVRAVLITTVYLRARWRSAPTLLNGSRPFHDYEGAPARTVRMIRINDIMRYADLTEWDAEALEIVYSTPGLSLLILAPRGNSLRSLADHVVNTSLGHITERMQPLRIAATLPLYTLRMTLLLPNKLEAMNMSSIVNTNNTQSGTFRLSHAVQRIMFWAEAGRNAFKDDGIEWDEAPQKELAIDRPYIFYVRWKNKTLMNGNFVL